MRRSIKQLQARAQAGAQAGAQVVKDTTAKMEEAQRVAGYLSEQAKTASDDVHLREPGINLGQDTESTLTSPPQEKEVNKIESLTVPTNVKGGLGLNDLLTGIDKVDVFSNVNRIVLSITDDVGMLVYFKKMYESCVYSALLMLTKQTDLKRF